MIQLDLFLAQVQCVIVEVDFVAAMWNSWYGPCSNQQWNNWNSMQWNPGSTQWSQAASTPPPPPPPSSGTLQITQRDAKQVHPYQHGPVQPPDQTGPAPQMNVPQTFPVPPSKPMVNPPVTTTPTSTLTAPFSSFPGLPDDQHHDSIQIFGYTFRKAIEATAWSRKRNLATRDPTQVYAYELV